MKGRCLAVLALTLLSASLLAAPPPHKLKVSVGPTYIDVEKATPAGKILVIGYERTSRAGGRVLRRVEREAFAGGDGKARLPVPHTIVPNSFWVGIDLATGGYAAVTADGRHLKEAELPSENIRKDSAGQMKKVVTRFDYVFMLLVRPGVGAWQGVTGDGGPLDEDGVLDGKIELPAAKLEKRGDATAFTDQLQERDLVFVFVPRQMGYVVTEVKK